MTFDQCCGVVDAKCPDGYAKAYANAWLDGTVLERAREYGISAEEAARRQAGYIFSNIQDWRGVEARTVRAALIRIMEGKND